LIILQMKRVKDPFAAKIKRRVEDAIIAFYPQYAGKVSIIVKEAAPKEVKPQPKTPETNIIKKVIAVSSCKGGVGKSTVTAFLARTLAERGYKVGLVDTDIYGPSIPQMFGVEGYMPSSVEVDGKDLIEPCVVDNIKIMSIGFFIKPTDALVWRGPMATNALKQLIHQTKWDTLDYLLIDLPPGTGDVHLTVLSELKVNGAIIVTTPQKIALADVVRGIEMFGKEGIKVPILGLVENMSWFTPAEALDKKYYIFGKGGGKELAAERGIPLIAQIPIILAEGEDVSLSLNNKELKECYDKIAAYVI
ncbi:MAG: Mrp/NBP35 family ATP-binding protein, partial [Rikenellaceae bacterium]